MNKKANLVLSGGGVKGIAYVGMFKQAEELGIEWQNMCGVSSGSIAGTYKAAGYSADELKKIMFDFNFSSLKVNEINEKTPVIARYLEFAKIRSNPKENSINLFLSSKHDDTRFDLSNFDGYIDSVKKNIMTNIASYGMVGSVFDGDMLEEWIFNILKNKGIRTFGDLRYGVKDRLNPNGYKIRMTAFDLNRVKVIVLPDDIKYYGIEPDSLEVAKAIRMSTSVPFAFKPVEFKVDIGGKVKTHHIVDGAVYDNFPSWLVRNTLDIPAIGFKLELEQDNLISVDTSLNILKSLISAVHNTGVPEKNSQPTYVCCIDTNNVSFLNFDIGDNDKDYLYTQGQKAASELFEKINFRVKGAIKKYSNRLRSWMKRL